MPKYTNSFTRPKHLQETILAGNGKVVGTIRIKPSSVLWKPKGAHEFFCVELEKFTSWIISPRTAASKTKS